MKTETRRAKPGDRIVLRGENLYTFDRPGDILTVDGVSEGCPYVYGRNHPRDTGEDDRLCPYSA